MKPFRHHLVPDLPRRTVFGNLLKEIAVGIEEEGKPWSKIVNVQTGAARPFDIFDSVIERKREFLERRRPCFSNMVATDGDRVPLRNMSGAELECVDDELHRGTRREDVRFLRNI